VFLSNKTDHDTLVGDGRVMAGQQNPHPNPLKMSVQNWLIRVETSFQGFLGAL
jgi:hypothetical protein